MVTNGTGGLWSPRGPAISANFYKFHDPEEALEDSSYEATDLEESEEDLSFVLDAPRSSKRYSHPSTDVIEQLWDVFTENVDPLIKIVHVPSLQLAVRQAISNIDNIPRTFEALLFAIYAIALLSMRADDCEKRLGQDRAKLLSHYTSATKWALNLANFMGTSSIVCLQALVLHLFTIRLNYGPRTVWTFTGLVDRVARAMGLHCDGKEMGLPPFEVEIRRRIWYQIKGHDFRASELAGFTKMRALTDDQDTTCEPPVNCDDADLYPGMKEAPVVSDYMTDSVINSMKIEFTTFAKKSALKFKVRDKDKEGNAKNVENSLVAGDESSKDAFVKEIQDIIEAKYLRYCDPSQPLQLYASLVGRSALNTLRFLTHHPRSWSDATSQSEREMVWKVSITILEQFDMIQSNRHLQRYSWYSNYFMQWHVFIHVLDTLRAEPLRPDADKTWRLVEATWENNPDMISNTKKAIHVAVGHLCVKAYCAYESALLQQGRRVPQAPGYVSQLRGQREVAKQKKAAREARNRETQQAAAMTSQLDANMSFSDNNTESQVQWTGLDQAGLIDPFWYSNDGSGNMMDLDDFMIGQDNVMDDLNAGEHIDWTQWDNWVGELNAGGGSNAGCMGLGSLKH